MLVNADFTRSAIVMPDRYEWVASPSPGVERVMLDRVGGEVARATSIVRYAPRSVFPPHRHPGGEEILVLSGTFSADGEHFPAGWYLRNPPGSSHRPASHEGATIFVKLMQMAPSETMPVRIDTRDPANWHADADGETCELFSGGGEHVCVHRLAPGRPVFSGTAPFAEMLVLQGALAAAEGELGAGTWLRLPAGTGAALTAGTQGVTLYRKTGGPACVDTAT